MRPVLMPETCLFFLPGLGLAGNKPLSAGKCAAKLPVVCPVRTPETSSDIHSTVQGSAYCLEPGASVSPL